MPRVDPALERVWRHNVQASVRCPVRRGGNVLPVELDVREGSVSMTDEPGVRSTLSMTVRAGRGLWDALAPQGTIVWPVMTTRAGVRTWDTTWGPFVVSEQSLTYDGAGNLRITGKDLWRRIQTRGLDRPATPRGEPAALAARYARDAMFPDVTTETVEQSTARVGDVVYLNDRAEMVGDLLDAAGRVGYVNRAGRLIIRKPPTVNDVAAWELDAHADGVWLSGERSRSDDAVRNRIIVRPAGSAWFPQIVVDDTDPRSPTWVSGPMGVRGPRIVRNPAIRTRAQALILGRQVLRQSTSLGAELTVEAAPHWGLDPGDVVSVTYPPQNGDGHGHERHVIASVTHPFPRRGQFVTQSITVRSSRPDGGQDIDEEAP